MLTISLESFDREKYEKKIEEFCDTENPPLESDYIEHNVLDNSDLGKEVLKRLDEGPYQSIDPFIQVMTSIMSQKKDFQRYLYRKNEQNILFNGLRVEYSQSPDGKFVLSFFDFSDDVTLGQKVLECAISSNRDQIDIQGFMHDRFFVRVLMNEDKGGKRTLYPQVISLLTNASQHGTAQESGKSRLDTRGVDSFLKEFNEGLSYIYPMLKKVYDSYQSENDTSIVDRQSSVKETLEAMFSS